MPSLAAGPASQRLGVRRGDRVAAYLPNIPEAIVALLATASLGAIWSSCAPEFGVRAVIDRFAQIEPRVLLAIDGYRYGDKAIDRRTEVAEIRAALPSVETTVVLAYLDPEAAAWLRRRRLGGARRFAGPARVRGRAVRPPAVHPLLVGHDRPAQADRPRPRRDPPGAPQGARPPHGPRARRTASCGSPRPAG